MTAGMQRMLLELLMAGEKGRLALVVIACCCDITVHEFCVVLLVLILGK